MLFNHLTLVCRRRRCRRSTATGYYGCCSRFSFSILLLEMPSETETICFSSISSCDFLFSFLNCRSIVVLARLTRVVSWFTIEQHRDGIPLFKLSTCHPVPMLSPCALEVKYVFTFTIKSSMFRMWYLAGDDDDGGEYKSQMTMKSIVQKSRPGKLKQNRLEHKTDAEKIEGNLFATKWQTKWPTVCREVGSQEPNAKRLMPNEKKSRAKTIYRRVRV